MKAYGVRRQDCAAACPGCNDCEGGRGARRRRRPVGPRERHVPRARARREAKAEAAAEADEDRALAVEAFAVDLALPCRCFECSTELAAFGERIGSLH